MNCSRSSEFWRSPLRLASLAASRTSPGCGAGSRACPRRHGRSPRARASRAPHGRSWSRLSTHRPAAGRTGSGHLPRSRSSAARSPGRRPQSPFRSRGRPHRESSEPHGSRRPRRCRAASHHPYEFRNSAPRRFYSRRSGGCPICLGRHRNRAATRSRRAPIMTAACATSAAPDDRATDNRKRR